MSMRMNSTTFHTILFLMITFASAEVRICSVGEFLVTKRHPSNCSQFVLCMGPGQNQHIILSCPANLVFDPLLKVCNFRTNLETSDSCFSNGGSETPSPAQPPRQQACDHNNCKLPECSCFGWTWADFTNGSREDVPQMVMITFDDAVRQEDYTSIFSSLFDGSVSNPDGCPARATFFLSHFYSDYAVVRQLYEAGHDISLHSFTHRLSTYYSEASVEEWGEEVGDQRQTLLTLGLIPSDDVQGARAPYLQTSGRPYFQMLSDYNYTYDSSVSFVYDDDTRPAVGTSGGPIWPFTLDYGIPEPFSSTGCSVSPCIKSGEGVPGVWEVPLQVHVGLDGSHCAILDHCPLPETDDEMVEFLSSNFARYYNGSRAPFLLSSHASPWLGGGSRVEGVKRWMREVSELGDVWFVTISDVIGWMESPSSEIPCGRASSSECGSVTACQYSLPDERPDYLPSTEYSTRTCSTTCPDTYPLPGNPRGE